jgi:hypothetical protein
MLRGVRTLLSSPIYMVTNRVDSCEYISHIMVYMSSDFGEYHVCLVQSHRAVVCVNDAYVCIFPGEPRSRLSGNANHLEAVSPSLLESSGLLNLLVISSICCCRALYASHLVTKLTDLCFVPLYMTCLHVIVYIYHFLVHLVC